MAEPNKKSRRDHLKYFTLTIGGRYEYTGPVCRCQNPPAQRRALLWQLGTLCTGMAAVVIAAGCTPVAGMMNSFYVLLPYLWALLAVISVCWGFIQLLLGGEPLRRYVYDKSYARLPLRAGIVAAGAAATAAGECLYLLLHGRADVWAAVFLLCQGGLVAAALALRGRLACLQYTVED